MEQEELIYSVENEKETSTFEGSLADPHAVHRHLQYCPCCLSIYL